MDFLSTDLWGPFLAIVVANILLSGDNAVVIAMAAASLPHHQQKKAIFWGSAAAIVLRIVLTIVATELLEKEYLKLIGGLALLYIGVQLLADSDDGGEVHAPMSLGAAVRTILIADLVMSVDNVIAVSSAAQGAPLQYRTGLLIAGLALSIPLIIAGSTLLMKVMERFPIIITLGAALLGFLAGEMFATDPATVTWFKANLPHAGLVLGAIGAVLVVVIGHYLKRRGETAPAT